MSAELREVRSALIRCGFKPIEHGAASFDVRRNASEVTTQNVHAFLSSLEADTFLVRLSVGVRLLVRDPSGALVYDALMHDLGRNGMFPIEWNVCLGWRSVEIESALVSIQQHGLPWLEQQSEPTRLIESLERALRDGVPVSAPSEPKVRRIFNRWLGGGDPPVEVLRPPVYNELLATLYAALGDIERSVQYMRKWISLMGSNPETKRYEEWLIAHAD